MKKVRRVMIFCANPECVSGTKKHYNPTAEDEEHCLFNYKDALNWMSVSKILERFPDLVVIDMGTSRGNLLSFKISREFPGATIIGIEPSKENEP